MSRDALHHLEPSAASARLGAVPEALAEMIERAFTVPGFGLASFPQHRDLSDAIVAAMPMPPKLP